MNKRLAKSPAPGPGAAVDYAPLLAEIKARVQIARVKAGLAANRELLALYWDVGRLISEAQRTKGYGKKVVERLAADVQREFPGLAGFSPLNVWRMRAFYAAYAEDPEILSQAVTELGFPRSARMTRSTPAMPEIKLSQPATESSLEITPAGRGKITGPPDPFASLPWGHNLMLLHKLDVREARLWYAAKAVEHGWSRNVLELQIESGLHHRQGRAVTNFKTTLPPAQSDLAQGLIKDPYLFDFLTLRDRRVGLCDQAGRFVAQVAQRCHPLGG